MNTETKKLISVTEQGDKVAVTSPYHPDFVVAARKAGGKWDGGAWIFSAVARPAAEQIINDVYGSGAAANITIKCIKDDSTYRGPVEVAGRIIATARGRDSGAKVGDGCYLVSGDIYSGGSVKNWQTIVAAGTTMIIEQARQSKVNSIMDDPYWELVSSEQIDNDENDDNPLAEFADTTILDEARRRGLID